MIVLLLAIVAQLDPIPLTVELRLPIPTCIPTPVGIDGKALTYPPDSPLVIDTPDALSRIIVASSCRYPRWICLRYHLECDSWCVWGSGYSNTPAKDETREDDALYVTANRDCWLMPRVVHCQIVYTPAALGDMNGDCWSLRSDIPLFAASKAPNLLRVFADFQNEYSLPPFGG